jgi:predicted MPP superfamily phosphohydrolase
VHIYEDSVLAISGSSARISLTILTNVYQRRPSEETLRNLVRQRPKAGAHLILTHQPTEPVVSFAEKHGYDLVAAGHTHGGQVVLRFFGFPLSASMFETPYVTGFFHVGKTWLSVTNGLGLTIAPVRFQAPAEVTLLTLRRRAE